MHQPESAFPHFLGSEIDNAAPERAFFHVIPVPYEATVSYGGGTGEGPSAILNASWQLETWDGESTPSRLGIHTAPAVDCTGGDEAVLARIEAAVGKAADAGGVPVLLGGEHTVTLGALRALKKRHGRFGVVQFDAHADLRESYEGSPYSHACVMRRAVELGLPLVQFGVRCLCLEEDRFRRSPGSGVTFHDARAIARHGLPAEPLPPDFPEKIYLTFDVDGLDSSVMPATGTPVPGGLTWREAMAACEAIIAGRELIGCDVVELAPIAGLHAADFAAATLVHALMGCCDRLAKRP